LTLPNSGDIEHIILQANGDVAAVPSPDVVTLFPFTGLESLTVTGAGDVTIIATSTALETVDASAATGDVTLILPSSAVLESAATGSGNDTVVFDAEDSVISTGAGDDIVTVGPNSDGAVISTGDGSDTIDATLTGAGTDLTINGGAGGDEIDLGNGHENLVYSAQTDSTYVNFDDVYGFISGPNTIDLSAFNLTGDTSAVAAGNTTQTTIAGLAGGVENFFDVGGDTLAVATFTETGNTYVLADLDNDGDFDAANDLVIQLVGVPGITAADIVFV
jgi:Ca2+-binding RTX toxin-like protein